MVSLCVYLRIRDEVELEKYIGATVIMLIAGLGQTILLTMIFAISLYPKVRTQANLWQVKCRATSFALMMVLFALGLPVAGLVLTLKN